MTKLATVDLNRIAPHPRNVRRDATPDDELVNSIRAQGILQPLGVVGADQGYLLIAGHRRHAAAVAAGLTQAPVVILEHLDTETKQLEAMLVENGRRQDLTAMEEATAYEQLTILGSDVDQIATATGRAKSTVRSRLKLTRLPADAQTALHEHTMTIEQAAELTDLDGQPELDEAIAALGSSDFDWRLRTATRSWRERQERERKIAAWEAAGLTRVERPENGWQNAGPCPLNWVQHRGDIDGGDAFYSDERNAFEVVTVVPERHLTPEEVERQEQRAAEDAQRHAENTARTKAREEAAALQELRVQHVTRNAVRAITQTTTLGDLSTVLPLLAVPFFANPEASGTFLADHAGYERGEGDTHWSINTDRVREHLQAKPATEILALIVGALYEYFISLVDEPDTAGDAQASLDVLKWLENTGVTLSSIEAGWREQLEQRVADDQKRAS